MPYETTWEEKGICWTYTGTLTSRAILASNIEFYSDPRSDNSSYQIVDLVNVDRIDSDKTTMQELAAFDHAQSKSTKNLKVAFICNSPEMVEFINKYINLSRQFRTTWSFKIFDNINDARTWALLKYIVKK